MAERPSDPASVPLLGDPAAAIRAALVWANDTADADERAAACNDALKALGRLEREAAKRETALAENEAAHRALDDFDAPRTEPHFRSPYMLSGRVRSLRSRLVIEGNQRAGKFLKRAEDAEARVREVEAERDAQEKVLVACARLLGDDMPAWAPLPVREIGCSRCEAAEATVARQAETLREATDLLIRASGPLARSTTPGSSRLCLDVSQFVNAARAVLASPEAAAAEPPYTVMLCAICSEPLNGAILNEDNKWVHPECEESAEWNAHEDDESAALPAVDAPPEPTT